MKKSSITINSKSGWKVNVSERGVATFASISNDKGGQIASITLFEDGRIEVAASEFSSADKHPKLSKRKHLCTPKRDEGRPYTIRTSRLEAGKIGIDVNSFTYK